MYGDERWGVPGYTEVRELGSGASGRVVLARRDHDGTEVAIKYLSDELRADVSFVARFRHEARLLGAMRSPHNARLIDYVETGHGAAIVMELVNGVSLRQLIRSEGATGPEAALTVLKGSLQGLATAHAMSVVHRDYKPENVIVQGDGASKLVDFGIAVEVGEGAGAAGTPPYMAPEQWAGSPASPATDVYAATVVFFECLTGARPFRAGNMAALARQHQATPPPVDEVPEPLRPLIERGMAKRATDRPPSAESFLVELETIAREAYGSDWEERGKRRLASLVGLLLLFPATPEEPAEARTTFAETRFGRPGNLLSRIPVKTAVITGCAGVVIAAALVMVNPFSDPELRAQSTDVTPTPSTSEPVDTGILDEPLDEPDDTGSPEEEPDDTGTPSPDGTAPDDPAAPGTAAPDSTVPTRVPTTASPTRSTPSRTSPPRPTRTRTRPATPTGTADPEVSGRADRGNDGAEPSRTPAPTRSTPSRQPPIRTPQQTPTTSTPTGGTGPTGTAGPTGGTEPTREPTLTSAPPGETPSVPATVLALGLVTSGAVPVTLAMGRRMAGRHRRTR